MIHSHEERISGPHMVTEAEEGADMYFYSKENETSVYKPGLAFGEYTVIRPFIVTIASSWLLIRL